MADLIKNKSVFYDLQEPTANDLNYIGEAAEEQIKVRFSEMYTDGVLGLDHFEITNCSYSNGTLTFDVGPGIAYIKGRRVEIPERDNTRYNVQNPAKDPTNDNCPSSTGCKRVTVANVGSDSFVTVYLLYVRDYDPNSYDINPESYKRRYTKIRDGYAIGYSINSTEGPNQLSNEWKDYVEGSGNQNWTIAKDYITIGIIRLVGGVPTVDRSVVSKAVLKEEIQPLGETEVHQTTFHTSGVSGLSTPVQLPTFKYYIKDTDLGSGGFITNPDPITLQNAIKTTVLYVRTAVQVPTQESGTVTFTVTTLNGDVSREIQVDKNTIVTAKFDFNSATTITRITISGSAGPSGTVNINYKLVGDLNVPKTHIIYKDVLTTYPEFHIYTEPENGVGTSDVIKIRKSFGNESFIYVAGKRVKELLFNNQTIIETVDDYCVIRLKSIYDVGNVEGIRYLVVTETGNLEFRDNLSSDTLALAKVYVEYNNTTDWIPDKVGGLSVELLEDYRKPVDSHKPYRFAKYPIEIVPTKDSEPQTPEIVLSANTEPTTNIPYLPLRIRIENDNGKSKLVFEGSIGNNILTILDNGNVGIGTVNPDTTLEVNGNIKGTNLSLTSLTPGSVLFADNGGLISQDNNNLYWDNVNKRLGIGVTNPPEKLTIAGSIGIQGAYNPYIGTLDNSSLRIVTNNNSRIFIASDGRVSIGTTLPGEGQLYVVTYDAIPAIKGVGCCYGVVGCGSNIGVFGYGNCIGICGCGCYIGVYGYGDNVGVYGTSSNIGICSWGNNIGICSWGNNIGICSCSYYIGICSYGNCTGIYGQGGVAVCGDGVYTGVIGSGCNVGVYGYSSNVGICGYGYWTGIRSCGDYIGICSFGCYIGVCGCSCNIGIFGYGPNVGVCGCSCNTGILGYGPNVGVCGCGLATGASGYSCCYTGVSGFGPVYGVYGSSNNTGVYGYGIVGVWGNGTSVGMYGVGTVFGVCGRGNCGVVGDGNDTGVYGWGCGYDFYAAGPGTNYGPFTGAHDTIYSQGEFQPGDVVVVKDICFKRRDGVSSVIPEISHTVVPCDKRVLGVYNIYLGCENCDHWVYKEGYTTQKFNWATVNALGEGLVKVKENEFGNIEIGDLLTTSDTPGFAMKQSDDIVHNYTLGKAAENVDWSTIPVDPEKGFKWTTIAVFYYAG